MRELKFRVYDKKRKKMAHLAQSTQCYSRASGYKLTFGDDFPSAQCEVMLAAGRFSEIMQYTGMRGYYGREIYEGDYVGKFGGLANMQGVVKFGRYHVNAGVYGVEYAYGFYVEWSRNHGEGVTGQLVVIGNIHEGAVPHPPLS